MPYLNDLVLDNGLDHARVNAQTIHACSAEPADYAGVAAVSLGSTTLVNAALSDRTGGGREVVCTPQSGATYDASGTVSHYAIVDDTGTTLLAANAVAAAKAVNAGDAIDLDAVEVAFPDAVSA